MAPLLAEIRACTACAAHLPLGPNPVVQASTKARLVIAGQAPGLAVHKSGKPFDDPSGARLRQWMGIDMEDFYNPLKVNIVPMGFCYPGRNKNGGDCPPRPECRALWHDKLFASLPEQSLILVIGAYAQRYHLGSLRKASLTETVRNWEAYGPVYVPLPHPSPRNIGWLKRNPWFDRDVVPMLRRKVADILGREGETV
ncbi:uracil-DNA glycosylase family protein [Iodidimonas muriae]|uniref:uracil-DNA glycosylase family protein n=1 Tax=Iodidimonas muriae TaxID=261467 RepID=UPI001E55127C|nr:uracil-DNA glycosylase family protein [Iodidimonas muriae]